MLTNQEITLMVNAAYIIGTDVDDENVIVDDGIPGAPLNMGGSTELRKFFQEIHDEYNRRRLMNGMEYDDDTEMSERSGYISFTKKSI